MVKLGRGAVRQCCSFNWRQGQGGQRKRREFDDAVSEVIVNLEGNGDDGAEGGGALVTQFKHGGKLVNTTCRPFGSRQGLRDRHCVGDLNVPAFLDDEGPREIRVSAFVCGDLVNAAASYKRRPPGALVGRHAR
jgi:hypothetical protein